MNSINENSLDYKAIGQRIRQYRKLKKLSQEELSEKIGISPTHMSHIETGGTKLSLPVLVEIAKSLNVSTDNLLFQKEGNTDFSQTIHLLEMAIETLKLK